MDGPSEEEPSSSDRLSQSEFTDLSSLSTINSVKALRFYGLSREEWNEILF
ncbi:unnamed protein product [Haemonchus placei]|uniref:Sigma70_r1_2 domain-containing protein n=1 Tax=Haemonchus placei TaxID=6290 RepID=A0A0N4WR21_HAEPC|nr:unnamed protein product [Haemonchus placei]